MKPEGKKKERDQNEKRKLKWTLNGAQNNKCEDLKSISILYIGNPWLYRKDTLSLGDVLAEDCEVYILEITEKNGIVMLMALRC